MQQKNELLSMRAKEFIKSNPWFCLKNALGRYLHFILEWKLVLLALTISTVGLLYLKKLSIKDFLCILAAFLLFTIIPAFGLYITRYFVYVIVIASVIVGSFAQLALCGIIKKCIPKRAA